MPTPAEWGARVAHGLRASWPELAAALESGVRTDCSSLMNSLESSNSPEAAQLSAIFYVVEAAVAYYKAEAEKAKIEISGLQAQVSNLTNQTNYLTTQNDALTKTIAATRVAGGGGNRRETTDPDKFTAEDTDIAKRQERFLNFRAAVNRVLTTDSHVFNTEYKKIQYIAGRLDGLCASQYRASFDIITENPNDPDLWTWPTTTELWRTLNTHYIVLDLAKEAEQELKKLKMANKPYPSFIAEFQVKSTQANLTPEEQVKSLRSKVSDELASAAKGIFTVPGNSAITKWIAFYQQIWDRQRDEAWVAKDRSQASDAEKYHQMIVKKNNPNQPPPATAHPQGDPMDLSAFPNRQN
jgi:hypothetical protein